MRRTLLVILLAGLFGTFLYAQNSKEEAIPDPASTFPEPQEGQLVFDPPGYDELPSGPLRDAILHGEELFTNTQAWKGEYTFGDLNCSNCHLDKGRMAFSAPVWVTAVTFPQYRGKNWKVNSMEERIMGCFTYSMNGVPPEPNSYDMTSMIAYISWLATGAPMYPDDIYGEGYGALDEPGDAPDYERGEAVYEADCAICHGPDGQGQEARGEVVYPPLWGDDSYNWGAGMSRVPTLAAFVKHNMPLGLPFTLSDQEAWDVAQFINSHERPQDPRYTGDVKETREKYINFHGSTLYGTEVNGVLLGDHDNTGGKPFLAPPGFEPGSPPADE